MTGVYWWDPWSTIASTIPQSHKDRLRDAQKQSAPTWHIGDFVSKVSGEFPKTPGSLKKMEIDVKQPYVFCGVEMQSQQPTRIVFLMFSSCCCCCCFPYPDMGRNSHSISDLTGMTPKSQRPQVDFRATDSGTSIYMFYIFFLCRNYNPIYLFWGTECGSFGECHQDIDVQKMSHETNKSQERRENSSA